MEDHGKRRDSTIHVSAPFNAEPSRAALAEGPITPLDAFYVRNHGNVPDLDPDAIRLSVGGMVGRDLDLNLAGLRTGPYPLRELTATLQCAGNRRDGLLQVRDIPAEAPWGPGATGTATWRGVALRDVLAAADPHDGASDVAFIGHDHSDEADPPQRYGASIPLRKALRPEVLLAWEMNGEPLPAVHGGPLRVVVPGYIGARSVKWLERIEVRPEPWAGFYQSTAYRLLPVGADPAPGAGVPLGEVALNSDVLEPADEASVPAGTVTVRGYAFAGGERRVARVDVSSDGGTSWRQADLLDDLGRWAWRFWRCDLDLPPGRHEIVARAWDSAAATQPEHAASVWNPKGYVNNAWARIAIEATS